MAITRAAFIDTTPPTTTAVTLTGFGTLASGSSVVSSVIDNHTNADMDIYIATQVKNTTTLATGYLSTFVQGSLDNSTFADSSAPNDILIGTTAIPANTTLYASLFNTLKAWPGALFVPPYIKYRQMNNSGTALVSGVSQYNGGGLSTA